MRTGRLAKTRQRTVISLFTGAGGLDLGLEAAGFVPRVAVEMDPAAVKTIRANKRWPVIDLEIQKVESGEILKVSRLKVGEADLLSGGPPCQPFSKSGYWHNGSSRGMEDPRAATLSEYLRVLGDVLPKVFIFENVPGARRQSEEAILLIKQETERINKKHGTRYVVSVKKLDAADYGVPQHRERVLVVGDRGGIEFKFPEPMYGASKKGFHPYRTAWDAIGDLQDEGDSSLKPNSYWVDLLSSIPEGKNYLHHTDRGDGKPLFGWRTRYWSFLLKLSKKRPSWTITATPGPATGPFHWKNRRLSMRELCRLQTFPDDYQIHGTLNSIQRQVGNAVPSALAELLGLEIRYQLLGDRHVRRWKRKLLPKRNGRPPRTERARDVPEKYQKHIGKHKPHPGTGLGPGARRREAT